MVLKPALLKGVWSQEEDAIIYDCIGRGIIDWSEVASYLPKRKAKHCRERWNNHLDPDISKGEWSADEEAKLLSAVEAHGTSWNLVARQIPGRSEAMIQQHWNAIVFRNAVNAGGVRRGRSKADSASATAGGGARARAKPSLLPVEPGLQLQGQDLTTQEEGTAGNVSGGRNGGGVGSKGPEPAVTLTVREKALMDHAFKTGLSAAAGGGGGGVGPPPELMGTTTRGGGIEPLNLSSEEDDLFAPLTAALLKEGSDGCSPADMPPPSPTASPLKPHKQQPDYTAIGDQLGDGWGVDDDPALADLYRSLDNIGESLFNEDTFELSFDFDSVDKPSPSCGAGGATQTIPSQGWDRQEKEESPFRRAAANAAATLEQRLSPTKRASKAQNTQTQEQARNLEEACARAAAAAAATSQDMASTAPSSSGPPAGPRVKQGFLRRLFSAFTEPGKQSRTPFSTVRGCLSEANAPAPPPPSPAVRPNPPGGEGSGGGENQAPRRGQPLSIALFAQGPASSIVGEDGKGTVTPTLKHGKVEVKVPPPQASGPGIPLSSLPASRFN